MTDLTAMPGALGIVIRTSTLLLCVSLLSVALRRASASVRHALWAVGLLAVLVFPVVSRWIPTLDLALLPERSKLATVFDTTPAPVSVPEAAPAAAPTGTRTQETPVIAAATIPIQPRPTPAIPRRPAQDWIAFLWALGSLLFLLGWLKSLWDLQRLTNRSDPANEKVLLGRLLEVQREIGVPGTVRLRISMDAISPMTWGIFRPVILLPVSALGWSPIRHRLVLAHEMAHVKRNDSVGQLLAQAVSTTYWFNPIVWYAVHRLHVERERACDDSVLRQGAEGADYVDHLLQITRGLNAGFSQSAVSMAHASQLKSRMVAILDSGMKRSRASRITSTTLLSTIGVLTLSIAAIQVTALSTLALPTFAGPLGAPLWSPESVEMAQPLAAAQRPAAGALDPPRAFINQYCLSCHNDMDRYANLSLEAPGADIARVEENRQLWEKVVRRLRAGRDDAIFRNGVVPPSAEITRSMIQFLEGELDRNAKTYVPPIGPHRLNRTEYTNAIRDLLDLEFESTQLLPPDDYSFGFDNMLRTLDYSSKGAAAYLTIAPIVSRLAIQTAVNSPSHKRIFVCDPIVERYNVNPTCAQRIVRTLVENAYRGFATEAGANEAMGVFSAGLKNGGFDSAIEATLSHIISNPKFIYRTEQPPADVKPGGAFRIGDLALASRLSFFLWSTAPDQELIDLAKQEKLHQPGVLEQQTFRMLKDYRAEALSANFAAQWLGMRWLQGVSPSPAFFPDFDEPLRQAMRREGELFFDSIVREDRNVVDLLDADYTFVNNRLSHLYGIPNVTGNQFRRVTLSDAFDVRRGILGKAGFLTISSNSNFNNRTSPVVRAKWIMDNLLGVRPPDPPPDVPPLKNRWTDPSVIGPSTRTAMEEMIAGIENPRQAACISCHKLIDPIGNALENFNPIGAWRSVDGGAPVNAADTLYDGTKVNGPADLRRWLVAHSDQFVQTMTEKLMTYALGRGVEPQDMPLIRAIDREAARNNNRFSSLVLGIVKSDVFQMNSK